MQEQILETWAIHDRINLYMLDAIAPEALAAPVARGRTVGEQFAHMHNVRVMWLQTSAPDLVEDLAKVEKADAVDRDTLRSALEASGLAIGKLLQLSLESGGKVKGFKPHAVAFLAYLISHDAYHRGEIGLILAQIGYPLDRSSSYGLWEWGTR
jgi:uncharacterized damage-inducible protein DinB